jgi:hypothetical protein
MPCMNWKLIAAVIAAGLVVAIAFPGAAAAAIPLLVLAVCPLAMIVAFAVLGRSAAPQGDNSEIEELRAEVARLRGDAPAEERL